MDGFLIYIKVIITDRSVDRSDNFTLTKDIYADLVLFSFALNYLSHLTTCLGKKPEEQRN